MKKLTIAALMAGQMLAAAQPAFAADLTEVRTQQMGAFAGFRLRVPLDGNDQQRQIRAGLALAPTMHGSRLRIGEGVELGVSGGEPLRLSIAGTPVSRLARGPSGPGERRLGVSTVGWVAIGVGTVVAVLGVGYLVFEDLIDCDEDEECS